MKRAGLVGFTGKEIRTPVKAIRANCLECVGGSSNEVKMCPITNCPLYPFRFGKNPYFGLSNEKCEENAVGDDEFEDEAT